MNEDEYNVLKDYNFRDSIGHPLENCIDFRNIIDELNSLRVLQELTVDEDIVGAGLEDDDLVDDIENVTGF